MVVTVGVLALQGGFLEHLNLVRQAARLVPPAGLSAQVARSGAVAGNAAPPAASRHAEPQFDFVEVRSSDELALCDALIIPGGESTAISLAAARLGLLEPLREFVKVDRKPVWGTCAGLILLAEAADATKKGGQELIGGLDVRVHRNHFGRQIDSFIADIELPFLADLETADRESIQAPFPGVFIRAPVVEKVLSHASGAQLGEEQVPGTVVAPSKQARDGAAGQAMSDHVDILGVIQRYQKRVEGPGRMEDGDGRLIIAVRQGNVFGTSFHPELTSDCRIHAWWLQEVLKAKAFQK